MIEKHECLNCKWRSDEPTHICTNEESDNLGQFVDRTDECDKWEFIGD